MQAMPARAPEETWKINASTKSHFTALGPLWLKSRLEILARGAQIVDLDGNIVINRI